ncbi:Tex family protein [Oceanisphaera arctica]|uniref:RNA-binding transcriptional accessory protein n=1 Tax=Oceanisphaera arctica TaxID=641510 RepID=A0A2P5TIU5_9GAMM|nr:Tex family protein [Oceanisphaera arctica]PPL14755.1 RNA-binding transcriptional accessory protein [Oceanisphaera arctica]GHA15166.1 transcription accessory protein [Oceanisphaera arctica]
MTKINHTLATELAVSQQQVDAAVRLLDEGATVPFIARYRKEATGGLDDTQLRNLHSRLGYLRELEDRRAVILNSISEQGKLTESLKKELLTADTKTRLEDLYLPYKPKRRTKGQMAIEAGLQPLADALFEDPNKDPQQLAAGYIKPDDGVADVKAALDGAKYILMERFAEQADLLDAVRRHLNQHGQLQARVTAGQEQAGAKFKDYFEHQEPISRVPSHRLLAMLRGRNEGVLSLSLVVETDADSHPCEAIVARHVGWQNKGRAADSWLAGVVSWTWRVKLSLQMETELLGQARELAEAEAIKVFALNLQDLLMAAPAGARVTMGLDPGIRTGVKVVVVDGTGKLLAQDTVYPFEPFKKVEQSLRTLDELCRRHNVSLVSIGNGTASRETERLVETLMKQSPELKLQKVVVSEAGASVYSASELAANEFPSLDVSLRGAVSIARRLQDPLAELVKIDPKSIGVGQYQHDVSQSQLARNLDAVVEDCVNAVGVDVNMASAPLLTRVSGLTPTLAQNIVAYRDEQGVFTERKQLLKVPRLGPKAFEQCAGFLRIRDGKNPLDASSVHPEAYPVVERILATQQQAVQSLIGNSSLLKTLNPKDYTDEHFGLPTVQDILRELDKPGRDPRPEFKAARFMEGVEKPSDLIPDMLLEGVVTNVTNFGAFVDIGVHQDGLVHISALTDRFIKDPREVVKAGDIVKVKVMEVDLQRKRIALTMRLEQNAAEHGSGNQGGQRREDRNQGGHRGAAGNKGDGNNKGQSNSRPARKEQAAPQGAMGAALAAALQKKK